MACARREAACLVYSGRRGGMPMFCPACQAVLPHKAERCPICDAELRPALAVDSVALVEAAAVTPVEPAADREPGTAIVVCGAQDRALTPLTPLTPLTRA